jgi:hypothetical protein
MSANDRPGREVAHRVFATEFDDATFQYSEGDEERSPNYVVTPTGARINRLFFVGVLTELERVNDDVVRARVVDPTGAFVIYAGQYQPDELAALERIEPPAFVAVTGKARTFEPDDGNRIYTSVRPESINEVDGDTRDRWVVQAAEHTLDRIATMARAANMDLAGGDLADALRERGVGESVAAGIPLALAEYGTGAAYLDALRTAALDAARVVAGDRDEVRSPDIAPDGTRADAATLAALAGGGPGTFVPTSEPGEKVVAGTGSDPDSEVESGREAASEPAPETGTEAEPESEPAPETGTEAEPESEAAPEMTAETDPGEDSEAVAEEPETADEVPSDEDGGATADDELGDFEASGLSDTDETTTATDETPTDAGETTTATDETPTDADETTTATDESTTDAAPATDEMYEFDEEERQQIEEEYGTEFETGTEVGGPGEADIDTPAPDSTAEPDASDPEPTDPGGDDADATDATEAADEPETAEEPDGLTDSEPVEESGTAAGSEPTGDDDAAPGADAVADDADVDDAVMDAMRDLDDGDGADREAVIEAVVDGTGADREAVEDAIQEALMGGQCYEPGEDRLKPI